MRAVFDVAFIVHLHEMQQAWQKVALSDRLKLQQRLRVADSSGQTLLLKRSCPVQRFSAQT